MSKSNKFTLQTVPDFEIYVKPMKLLSSINFMSQEKSNKPLVFLRKFILKVSNLDEVQMEAISLQDAISVAMYYRLIFDENKMVIPSMAIDATMFHRSLNEKVNIDATMTIGEYRFTPLIKLDSAILAEAYAINSKQQNLLGLYIMASGCIKGVKEGWDAINNLMDDEDGRGELIKYNELVGEYGTVKVSLLEDSEEGKTISIISTGGTAYAVGFLDSNLLAFGL